MPARALGRLVSASLPFGQSPVPAQHATAAFYDTRASSTAGIAITLKKRGHRPTLIAYRLRDIERNSRDVRPIICANRNMREAISADRHGIAVACRFCRIA